MYGFGLRSFVERHRALWNYSDGYFYNVVSGANVYAHHYCCVTKLKLSGYLTLKVPLF